MSEFSKSESYAAAGVDITAGYRSVELMKKSIARTMTAGVALGSDAFFPFDDSIERGKRSGVSYVAEPGGSIRDQLSIDAADKYGMVMAFTGLRLFHH